MKDDINNFKVFNILKKSIKNDGEIIYFGDSTVGALGKNDLDKRSIGSILEDQIKKKVHIIAGAAYSLDIFYEFCRYLIKKKVPEIIIIPINFRSFSPVWDKKPEWQFQKEIAIIRNGLYLSFFKPLKIFKSKIGEISKKDFINSPIYLGEKKVGVLKDFKKIKRRPRLNKKNKFLIQYMFKLKTDHRKMRSINRILNLFKNKKTNIIFYITPIDFQSGYISFRSKFKDRIIKNSLIIKKFLKGKKAILLDLSVKLSMDCFAWRKNLYPNEHLNEKGRKYVANELAKILNSHL